MTDDNIIEGRWRLDGFPVAEDAFVTADKYVEVVRERDRYKAVAECANRVREMFELSQANELLVAHDDLADALDALNAEVSDG